MATGGESAKPGQGPGAVSRPGVPEDGRGLSLAVPGGVENGFRVRTESLDGAGSAVAAMAQELVGRAALLSDGLDMALDALDHPQAQAAVRGCLDRTIAGLHTTLADQFTLAEGLRGSGAAYAQSEQAIAAALAQQGGTGERGEPSVPLLNGGAIHHANDAEPPAAHDPGDDPDTQPAHHDPDQQVDEDPGVAEAEPPPRDETGNADARSADEVPTRAERAPTHEPDRPSERREQSVRIFTTLNPDLPLPPHLANPQELPTGSGEGGGAG